MSATQTFHDHILELRKRVLWVFLSLILSGVIGFVLRVRIIKFVQKPLGHPLYYTNPAGSFNFEIKVAVIISLFIALPIIVYQILRFIGPALPTQMTKKLMFKIIGASFGLATTGIVFGYLVIVPLSLTFFSKYSTAQLKPLISADSYLSYLVNNLVIFALVFQIPLIILFINRMKPLKPGRMLHYQRHVIVGSLALAIALPFTYDPISQFVVAIPIIFLYYLSVLFVWYANRHLKPALSNSSQSTTAAAQPPAGTITKPVFGHNFTGMATSRSMDGIIYRNAGANHAAKSVKTIRSNPQVTDSKQVIKPEQQFGDSGLTIDGVSPILSS